MTGEWKSPAKEDGSVVEHFKSRGDEQFRNGDLEGAIQSYTEAISKFDDTEESSTSAVVVLCYSNRSAAYLKQQHGPQFAHHALEDAKSCIRLDPTFVKGYSRKAAALHALKDYQGAIQVYELALTKFPDDKGIQQGLDNVRKELEQPNQTFNSTTNDSSTTQKKNNNTKKKKNPGLWKLAGRTIRKTTVGKYTLDGISQGLESVKTTAEATKQALVAPSGALTIDLEGGNKVYQQHDTVKGMIHLKNHHYHLKRQQESAEEEEAAALTITIEARRPRARTTTSSILDDGDIVVLSEEYRIADMNKQELYDASAAGRSEESSLSIPFELIIPTAANKDEDSPPSVLSSITQAVTDIALEQDSTVPLVWTIYASLHSGRHSLVSLHSEEYRLHVDA